MADPPDDRGDSISEGRQENPSEEGQSVGDQQKNSVDADPGVDLEALDDGLDSLPFDPADDPEPDQVRSTVVLCVDDPGTRHSLREWFEAHEYEVVTADARSQPDDGDLYVVDQGSLRRTAPAIADLKASQNAFLPCLLVAAGEHANRIARSEDDALDVVDDVLHIPLQTPALRRRVESLQRARHLSERLRKSTASYQRLVDVLPAGLFVLDAADVVTYANDAAVDLLGDEYEAGLTREQLIECVHPDDRDGLSRCFEPDTVDPDDAPRGPVRVRLQTTAEISETERPLSVDAADRQTTVEVTVTPLHESGGYQVLVQDITARENRLERLRVLDRAIQETEVGLTIADAQAGDNPLVFVNKGFHELTGYEEEAVLGMNCRFLQGDDTDPESVAAIRAAIDANEPVTQTIKNYRADGTPFWNRLDIAPVRDDDGEVTHFLGFQRDVTDRRERMRLFEHLHEATSQLQRARSPEAVAEVAVNATQEILEFDVSECWFPNEDATRLDTVAMTGIDYGHPLGPSDAEWTAFTQELPVMEVPIEDHDISADTGIVFSLGEYGVLGAADAARPYSDAVKDAGRVLADAVTVALDRASREAELAEAKNDLEHTLGRINDGFMALNADYEVTYLNEQAEATFPFDFDEAKGTVIWDLFPEAVDGAFWDGYHEALETQEPQTFEAYETQMESWFKVSAYPSEDGLTVYFRDITESRERKQELERYERIIQTAGDPIYSLDETGHFRDVNRAFTELTGYDKDEVIGEYAEIVLDPVDVTKGEQAVREIVEHDDVDNRTIDLTIITKGGERRRCEISIARLPGEAFSGTVGVIRDVTEMKDNEQRLAVLDRVLRHNLRNNLNIVAGRASILTDYDDTDVATVATIVEDAAQDVLDMAEKARAFQQALGNTDAPAREADLCEIVREAVEKEAKFGADDTESLSCTVVADGPLHIRTNEAVQLAVRELIDNAREHNPAENAWVQVDVTHEAGDAVVTVTDNGPAIPQTEIEVLGGVGEVETPLDHASGLGLWLVHWTATSFGGDLTFDRTDDGNRVTLRFPLSRH